MNITAITEKELRTCLRLTLNHEIKPSFCRILLAHFGFDVFEQTASQIALLSSMEQAEIVLKPLTQEQDALLEKTMEWASKDQNFILTLADPLYPKKLLEISDPPILLYAHGHIDTLKRRMLAMVGSRNATFYGLSNAEQFAKNLAPHFCIVSGLARGIDASAHQGALAAGCPQATIAVMATGMNYIYPSENKDLAHRVAEQGLIVSEYALDTRAKNYHFPRRNRIIAGLSDGTLVIEANEKSGSLITAQLSLDMGREVFAIPGSIHSPESKGCHALIKNGAKLVESSDDVLQEFDLNGLLMQEEMTLNVQPALTNQEEKFLRKMGFEALSLEELIYHTGIDLAGLNARLFRLEQLGCVKRLPDGRYIQLSR
ncbi:DNA-processing protein DprA [Basilea psittacipulmonis]|uniref:Uncharacterized protein n=1 Tax=Basilea psittacipulmonis DSM 24701 TaxID=1072685 RepID=A0A077DD36_9BURK|nr:DNA-processing protein DprA [Basilea psittacipulmonis]AIL32086.1 hypothetical protein IX83_00990 [Basilea psittacipulmonis DSM 24701]